MMTYFRAFFWSFICWHLLHAISCNQQDERFILTSNSLPDDVRFHPPIGNGHVATNVQSDTIYMNGLFNGREDYSSRARIPSTVSVDIVTSASKMYTLNMQEGIFRIDMATTSFNASVQQFAHREFPRLMVAMVTVERVKSTGDVEVPLTLNMGQPTVDFNLTYTTNADFNYVYGPIKATEIDGMVKPILHHYWTEVPRNLTLPAGNESLTRVFLTSLSIQQKDAWNSFKMGMNMSAERLLSTHKQAMLKLWNSGRIEIDGNLDLARDINAAMYNIFCSLPTKKDPLIPFYGLSPGGLSRGGLLNVTRPGGGHNDYAGHVFWDMDTWMMPPIMVFHPEMARMMISSRTRVLDRVRLNANESGHDGVKFPWEQAITGIEATPKWAGNTSRFQIHITADVGYALRQYLYATKDVDILYNGQGIDLALEIARYWRSRSTKTGNDVYEILGVMGPDEYHFNISNSVYTNYNAKLSLLLPQYTKEYMQISFNQSVEQEIQEFNDIASKMKILFDENKKYHPQYEGFSLNLTIKQSDVVLLGYPLMMPMPREIRRNDLELYEGITDKAGPDTGTWSMHTVGWLEFGEEGKAANTFKMMLRNVNDPFKVFSENPRNLFRHGGCVNFITGAGGLLQGVLFGYGGIRFRENQIDINPTKLPNTTSWAIRDAKYRGISFDVEIHGSDMMMHFKTLPQNKTIEVKKNEQPILALANNKINFRKGLAMITVHDDNVTITILEGLATTTTHNNKVTITNFKGPSMTSDNNKVTTTTAKVTAKNSEGLATRTAHDNKVTATTLKGSGSADKGKTTVMLLFTYMAILYFMITK